MGPLIIVMAESTPFKDFVMYSLQVYTATNLGAPLQGLRQVETTENLIRTWHSHLLPTESLSSETSSCWAGRPPVGSHII